VDPKPLQFEIETDITSTTFGHVTEAPPRTPPCMSWMRLTSPCELNPEVRNAGSRYHLSVATSSNQPGAHLLHATASGSSEIVDLLVPTP
jgi:hypothetical protein